MPMRKGTKVLGPSQEARAAAAARRAMRVQGEEERSEAPIARQGAQAARKAGGANRYISENKKGGKVMKGKKYAKGGSVSSRADGVAKKGKTKAKMIAMAGGGSCGMKKGK